MPVAFEHNSWYYNLYPLQYIFGKYLICLCHQLPGLHQLDVIRPARRVGEQDGLQRAALLATKRSRLAETAQRCMFFCDVQHSYDIFVCPCIA